MEYGLVFISGDNVYLGNYTFELGIDEFVLLSNFNDNYVELKPNEFSFVEVKETGDQIWLRDIRNIAINNKNIPNVTIDDFLSELRFPSDFANTQFQQFYLSVNKEKLN